MNYYYTGPAIDHSLLSPSGHISKRARKAAMARETKRLFPNGLPRPVPPKSTERERELRHAHELRVLAARGMHPRSYVREAERIESEWL